MSPEEDAAERAGLVVIMIVTVRLVVIITIIIIVIAISITTLDSYTVAPVAHRGANGEMENSYGVLVLDGIDPIAGGTPPKKYVSIRRDLSANIIKHYVVQRISIYFEIMCR